MTQDYITAAAFLFERAHVNCHGKFETTAIHSQGLEFADPDLIAADLVEAAKSSDCDVRGAIYWALGKRYDMSLLGFFQDSLRLETATDTEAAWQVMIALQNLGEPIFDEGRTGYGCNEEEMNRADARSYLVKINIQL